MEPGGPPAGRTTHQVIYHPEGPTAPGEFVRVPCPTTTPAASLDDYDAQILVATPTAPFTSRMPGSTQDYCFSSMPVR